MHIFDPRDWNASTGGPDLTDPNSHHLTRMGLIAALNLFCASLFPPAVVPAVFAALMLIAGLAAAATAAVREEPLLKEPRLTHWDEAAASVALGLLVKIALSAALAAHAAAGG